MESFDAIVRAHQGAVRTFLRRLTGNSALADELSQDIFLTAFRRRDRLSEVETLSAWLLRLAYRRFLDHQRRDRRRSTLNEAKPDADAPDPIHPGARIDIAAAMDALPPDRRACALLCLAQGHSHSDAAAITGLPLGTVKSHVARARSALQESLKDYQSHD